MLVSGSRANEFLASQGITALTNLVLARRDSILDGLPSVVPEEEMARLRHALVPSSLFLFPTDLINEALEARRSPAQDELVTEILTSSRILKYRHSSTSSAPHPLQGSSSSSVVPRTKTKTPAPHPSAASSSKKKKKRGTFGVSFPRASRRTPAAGGTGKGGHGTGGK